MNKILKYYFDTDLLKGVISFFFLKIEKDFLPDLFLISLEAGGCREGRSVFRWTSISITARQPAL